MSREQRLLAQPHRHVTARAPHRSADPFRVAGAIDWAWHGQELTLDLIPYNPAGASYRAYERLLCAVYGHHGVSQAARRTDPCMTSCSHLVLARAASGAVLGGVRIHLRELGPLPVQAALPRSKRLGSLLARLPGACAEPSGGVVHVSVRKSGLSHALGLVTVAALPLIGARAALCFGHRRVLPLYRTLGFVPDPRLGVHQYPDERYHSQVAVLKDTAGLPDVAADIRSLVLDTRARLRAARHEPGAGAVP